MGRLAALTDFAGNGRSWHHLLALMSSVNTAFHGWFHRLYFVCASHQSKMNFASPAILFFLVFCFFVHLLFFLLLFGDVHHRLLSLFVISSQSFSFHFLSFFLSSSSISSSFLLSFFFLLFLLFIFLFNYFKRLLLLDPPSSFKDTVPHSNHDFQLSAFTTLLIQYHIIVLSSWRDNQMSTHHIRNDR